MGALLSAPLTCCGSLLGSCAATAACKACSCACAVSQKTSSIIYVVIMVFTTFMAIGFRYSDQDIVIGGSTNQTEEQSLIDQAKSYIDGGKVKDEGQQWWNERFGCAPAHPTGWIICCANTCGGVYSVYRFSFMLCVFFAAMVLLTAGKTKLGAGAHRGFWLAKAVVLIGLLVSTLFISNETMEQYRQAARYLSFGFLLMQILLLIDFAYTWNETWLTYGEDSDDDGISGWRLGIVLSSLALYALSVAGWVLLFLNIGDSCDGEKTLISITILLCVALSAVSCSKVAPHGTLLTSAVVTIYCTFLCFSALSSNPNGDCNPIGNSDCSVFSLIVGMIVAGVSMASSAFSATNSKDVLVGRSETSTADDNKATELLGGAGSSGDDDDEIQPESHWYTHVMMAMCSLYMAMLLTDWSTAGYDAPVSGCGAVNLDNDMSSFWVKMVAQWVCFLLYGWTLLAPYLLREHRDFGIEFDFD